MIRLRSLVLALALGAGALPAAAADFAPPKPQERTLDNGLTVLVFDDFAAPTVHFRLLIRSGSVQDPPEKAGLAALTAAAVRRGSTALAGAALERRLEALGARLETDADHDFSVANLAALSGRWGEALEIFAGVVAEPALAAGEFDPLRAQVLAGLRRSREDPSIVADEHFQAVVQEGHAYARPSRGEEFSVGAVVPADLAAYHDAHWRPNNAILAVAGDVDADEVFAAVARAFAGWQPGEIPPRAAGERAEPEANRVRLLDRDDLAVAQLRVGHAGLARGTPEYFAVQLMNYALGGAPDSRLAAEIRARAGAEAAVGADWVYGLDSGSFVVSTAVRLESVRSTVEGVLAVIDDFRQSGPTAPELESAKRFFLGAYRFGFQTPAGVADQWLRARFYGLPDDTFARYPERVRAVTLEEARRVARAYLRTERVAVVAVGPAQQLAAQLSTAGEVVVLHYADRTGAVPETEVSTPVAEAPDTPESRARAVSVRDKALAAHGGKSALAAVRGWRLKGTVAMTFAEPPIEGQYAEVAQMPDRRRVEMSVEGQSAVQVIDGERGWASSGGRVVDLPASEIEALRAGGFSHPVRLLTALAAKDADLRYVGEQMLAGRAAEVIEWVRPDGRPARIYFDRETGLLAQLAQLERSPVGQGWVQVERVYEDYKKIGAIEYPLRVEIYANGNQAMRQTTAELQWTGQLGDELFRRPIQ